MGERVLLPTDPRGVYTEAEVKEIVEAWRAERVREIGRSDIVADRVLPSRELAQAWLDAGQLRGHPNSIDEWTIVRAYADGRLVDREAFDYEAAAATIALSSHLHPPWDYIVAAVDAALGKV